MENLNPRSAQSLLQETNYLISLPEVCLNLKKVLANPLHSTKDISQVIMYDPGLTTRLLRIVNSAFYGLVTPAVDITHALGILGEKDLNNLVVVTSIVQTMESIDTEVDLSTFWKSSIFSAVIARNIAHQCLRKKKEELFIAGLLLKVGKLLIYHNEEELFQHIKNEVISTNRHDYLIEKEVLGYDHAEVGSMMSQSWNFSNLLVDTIGRQYVPPEAKTDTIAHYIIFLANYCASELDFNLDKMNMPEELSLDHAELFEHLSINGAALVELLEQSYEEYFSAYDSFIGAAP